MSNDRIRARFALPIVFCALMAAGPCAAVAGVLSMDSPRLEGQIEKSYYAYVVEPQLYCYLGHYRPVPYRPRGSGPCYVGYGYPAPGAWVYPDLFPYRTYYRNDW